MGAGPKIKAILALKKMLIKDLAERLDVSPQVLVNKLNRDTLKYEDAERMINALDYELVIRDKKTGKEL